MFLDRISAVKLSTLKVGKLRYGLFLNEKGAVIDDGVCARLEPERFLLGTTGGGAERMAAWLEEWLQCEWRDLQVLVAPVTTAWAVLTLSGPHARATLAAAGTDIDLTPDAFPHMSWRDGAVAGVPARVMRVSFTGEVSFEVGVGTDCAAQIWDAFTISGGDFGLTPVGIDAWDLLRIEKGYVHVGAETDGSTSARDIGFGHVLKRSDDFIGRRSLLRADDVREDRLQVVGLETEARFAPLPVGAHLRSEAPSHGGSEGYVTSSGWGPGVNHAVALGMVKGGRARLGERLVVATGSATGQQVRIVRPGGYDPMGERLRG